MLNKGVSVMAVRIAKPTNNNHADFCSHICPNSQRANQMNKPYQVGDKVYKVRRTKDGHLQVYDAQKLQAGIKNCIAATFEPGEEQDAQEAADNLNKQNDETSIDTRSFFARLSDEARANVRESFAQFYTSVHRK